MQKAGCKKQGHCHSKREEAAWPLLFLNNNDPVFCTLRFSGPYFGPDFFSGSHTDPCFQNKNSGCWALIFWQPQWILATLKWFHRLFLSIFKLPICYCQLSPHFVLLTFRTAFMLTYWLSQHDLRINNFVGFSYYSVN